MKRKQAELIEGFYSKMSLLALEHGLDLKKCGPTHFQLIGRKMVNVYPTGGKYHLKGARKAFFYKSLEDLVDIAKNRTTTRGDQ